MKIISGGQTGVDRAALDVALSLGVTGGGWCPAGRLAEDGIIPAHYPLEELSGGGYLQRTEKNVEAADGTVVFHSGILRGGSKATADFCAERGKPCLVLDASRTSNAEAAMQLVQFVRANGLTVLNVAGPRASEWPSGHQFVAATLTAFLAAEAPSLSFVIPAHNEEHELAETLVAIRRAAEASQQSFEMIVVDDASTDATAAIAREFGARVVAVNRRQIAAVRNAGARVARGAVLFFVDADTRIAPGHVTAGLAALAAGCAGGSARVAIDSGVAFWARVFIRAFCAIYFAIGLGVGAFIFTRRESFETVGGFDEQFFAGEEVYLTLALKKLGRFKILREPIVTSARKVRMHSPRFVLTQSFSIVLGGKGALRNRQKLDLWYDGKRERRAT
ncbi:MAG: glycosyltransferase [Chthoniobacterales bacterium]|nr:glycosyltransferase [Chthoniobacterales bacterium]